MVAGTSNIRIKYPAADSCSGIISTRGCSTGKIERISINANGHIIRAFNDRFWMNDKVEFTAIGAIGNRISNAIGDQISSCAD